MNEDLRAQGIGQFREVSKAELDAINEKRMYEANQMKIAKQSADP